MVARTCSHHGAVGDCNLCERNNPALARRIPGTIIGDLIDEYNQNMTSVNVARTCTHIGVVRYSSTCEFCNVPVLVSVPSFNRSKTLWLIPTLCVLAYDIATKTNWSSLASIFASIAVATGFILLHWFIFYPGIMWVAKLIPNTTKLLAENKHLRTENQKLIQQVGQRSEYR